jgi:hypothetical protein
MSVSVSIGKCRCKVVLTIPLICGALLAQSASLGTQSRTFHVEGMIRTFVMNSAVSGVEVKFEGEKITKTVASDNTGFYKAELPVGTYTMTALWGRVPKYRRPLFRVSSPTRIILNITLYPDDPDCDAVASTVTYPDGTIKTHGPTQEDYNDACGGRDYLPVASKDGVRFELFVRYSNRSRSDTENTYNSYDRRGPVFVAYNLFTLMADQVIYDAKNRTLAASGNVVTADVSGKTEHSDAIRFKIENGEAVPLP